MLTLQIHNPALADKISQLLIHQFENDSDKMLQELFDTFVRQQNRLAYSGLLTWCKDGLAYQKEMRR